MVLKNDYESYIQQLEASNKKLRKYPCPHCEVKLKTLSNNTSKNWDTLSHCPYCNKGYMKLTLSNNGPVLTNNLTIKNEIQ